MASIISASTTSGTALNMSADTTGVLQLATGATPTTAVTIDSSQRVAFVAGTAALPAITTSGDTNTGMFFPAADTIAFAEGGAEVMRIDSSGNLQVGPNNTNGLVIVPGGSASTPNRRGIKLSADPDGYFDFYIHSFQNNANFRWINGNGSSELMRIDSSGNLLVGTTSNPDANRVNVVGVVGAATMGLRVGANGNGAINWYNGSGAYVASVIVNASSVAYNTTSDYRLKDDIVPITGALDKVAQLKPVNWKWKADGSDGQGFVAHELAEIVPDCVSGEKDAVDAEGKPQYQGVDTSFLVATLTAAIQEQQTIINDLKARIETLEAK